MKIFNFLYFKEGGPLIGDHHIWSTTWNQQVKITGLNTYKAVTIKEESIKVVYNMVYGSDMTL